MAITFQSLSQSLSKWDHLGTGTWSDGARYWGNTESGPNFGWLHWVARGYGSVELDSFIFANSFIKPYQVVNLWNETCGFNLFCRALSLFGPHISSDSKRVMRHIDIVNVNHSEYTYVERFGGLIFGSNSIGGDHFFLELPGGPVLAVCRKTKKEVGRWQGGFNDFLQSELKQLNAKWRVNGMPPEELKLERFGSQTPPF